MKRQTWEQFTAEIDALPNAALLDLRMDINLDHICPGREWEEVRYVEAELRRRLITIGFIPPEAP